MNRLCLVGSDQIVTGLIKEQKYNCFLYAFFDSRFYIFLAYKNMFFILAYALPAFYHTTNEIVAELDSYSHCIEKLDTNSVHAYKIPSPEAPLKTFLLFGEHPRELISTETGFELIKRICSDRSDILE